MYTAWNRVNAVFFFAVSVVISLSAGSWVTSLWLPSKPLIRTLKIRALKNFRSQRESRHPETMDRAVLAFDLDADLRSVFNWNVKQLFVYVSASYDTTSVGGGPSDVVIWDTIIANASVAQLRLDNVFNKYPLVARRADLKGAAVTFSISWDIMPTTGLLTRETMRMSRIRLPTSYCTEEACQITHLVLKDAGLLVGKEKKTAAVAATNETTAAAAAEGDGKVAAAAAAGGGGGGGGDDDAASKADIGVPKKKVTSPAAAKEKDERWKEDDL